MFDVVRWPGPDGAGEKRKSPLTLQQLNAKARERAEARRNQSVRQAAKSGDGNGEPPAPVDKKSGDEAKELSQVVSKKEKKRKKRKSIVEDAEALPVLENPEPPSLYEDKIEKKIKKKKPEVSQSNGVDNSNGHSEPANELIFQSEARVQKPDDSSPLREKKKKKKKSILHSETQAATMEHAEESVSTLRVDVLAERKPDNNEEEREEVRTDVQFVQTEEKKKKKKKKNKMEPVTEGLKGKQESQSGLLAAQESEGDAVPTVVESVGPMPSGRGDDDPGSEFDLSRIERDVEKIMGHDPLHSKSASEGHQKGPPVLPWMRDPVEISSHKALPLHQVPGLDVRLEDALRKTGIEALFPVQVAVWHATVGPGLGERDLCVCSPTGSGKTLAYALPIVQKLSTRVLRRLRALIVLPTRDLAAQVKAVFDTIAPSVGLRVGLAVGQTSIVAEAAELVKFRKPVVHSFGNVEASDYESESCVDVLVATPGRLMDHLRNTKDFTLQHLYYLVVDETDRLLRQSYQDWLPNVLDTIAATESKSGYFMLPGSGLERSNIRTVRTVRHLGVERGLRGTRLPRMMKMVLSATLTRDPSKIAQLALHYPMYIALSAQENRYQLPEQLQAYKLVCKPGEKPLYLAALLQHLVGQTIVFTASVVATHRLFSLLSFFEGLSFKVVEYSSLQHQQARSKSLEKFRNGEVQVLVASDAMTRGMDVEGVANVVNYDMPVYAKTYVHRVGRTARAGRSGCSYTLLRREEVRHFKSLLQKADNNSCKNYVLSAPATEGLYENYLTALEKLKQITMKEQGVSVVKGGKLQFSREKDEAVATDDLFM